MKAVVKETFAVVDSGSVMVGERAAEWDASMVDL